ncbi:MAG: ferrochelatase [Caulobacteraceae bacterium]|nr:ferrochelatase [Caulobacteraceae bacterium]
MGGSGGAPRRIAVVLFNLGGPDRLSAVRPFLFNLFRDRAILDLPAAARYPLAALIAALRTRTAKANYALMGGASPLIQETAAQAQALRTVLAERKIGEVQVFTAMRYWRPDSEAAAAAVAAFRPDEVVLLPLYPQFSGTTTGSSLAAWRQAYRGSGRVRAVCCYPEQPDFIAAHARRIGDAFEAGGRPPRLRLLFSAHGLPQKVIAAGDPYQAQVEATAVAVASRLGGDWDWQVCYQSRVGPLAWIGPSTLEAIEAAGREGLGVLISPIAFVSEHVETLVELDHDYAAKAEAMGVRPYLRAAALGVRPEFIEALARLVLDRLETDGGGRSGSAYVCPQRSRGCPSQACKKGEAA